ncbi:class D beta-lactamase [Spirosoma flavum]|uniref:Beta-lactamase n=1 Tax=Spirosoma flavum TaxID=2048557 RepID=A0ABW6AD55_9BACT
MRTLYLLSLVGLLSAYRPPSVIDRPDFARFFEAEKLPGSFLLYDLKKDVYMAYRYDRCKETFLPASTFKIANTLIGLETGVLQGENSPMKWDGVKRDIVSWNQDHTLRSAFQVSCVPCYRELARKIGLKRMKSFVKKADYGHMDIHADNLDMFWLTGKSRISQVEEIDFLRRIYSGDVPFSEHSRAVLKKIMLIDDKPTYKLYGKTGWAINLDGVTVTGPNIGWFVGYVEKGNDVYFFATNIEHPTPVPDNFVSARRGITEKILAELGII